jgi:hypothetical protein
MNQTKSKFSHLTVQRKHNKLSFTIFRKPTSTDILIHNSSCHPNEHKLASINYLTNRLHSYPISEHTKDIELRIIKTILKKQPIQTYTHSHKTQTRH